MIPPILQWLETRFNQRIAHNPRYVMTVVLMTGLTTVLNSVPLSYRQLSSFSRAARPYALFGMGIGTIFSILSPFIIWIVFAVVFHTISRYLGGSGNFRETLLLLG